MSIHKMLMISFCLLLFAVVLPNAHADQWNQATRLTFTAPVEVPGVVLAAGTYWFSLMNDDTDRNIVQIWNADRTQLMATVLTVPDERLKPTGRTVIRFAERPSYSPEALHAWFYPGDDFGHEFVYPESEARRIAKRTNQPVLTMSDELTSNIKQSASSVHDQSVQALKNAKVKGVEPSGQDVDETAVATPANNGAR
jgi:hypothetical protein